MMSSPFTDEGTFFEQCPKCGSTWDGDCPDNIAWMEYLCGECGYMEGEYYGGGRCVLMEGDPEKQTDNPIPRKEAHDAD